MTGQPQARRLGLGVRGLGARLVPGGAGLVSLLGLPLPVAVIKRLHKVAETLKSLRLADFQDLVLEARRQSLIELVMERRESPVDLGGQPVELCDVFRDPVALLHPEVL